jgi:hypothetical protein
MSQVKVGRLSRLREVEILGFGIAKIVEEGGFDTTYKLRGHSQGGLKMYWLDLGRRELSATSLVHCEAPYLHAPLNGEILFQAKFYFLSTASVRGYVF